MLLRDMKFKCDLVVLGETKLKQHSQIFTISMVTTSTAAAVTLNTVEVDYLCTPRRT